MIEDQGDLDLIDVRLMNEYSAEIPLWFEGGLYEDNELGLSAELLAELRAFADRWEQNVGSSAFNDRFDSIPIVRELVDLWHVWPDWVDRPSGAPTGSRTWTCDGLAKRCATGCRPS